MQPSSNLHSLNFTAPGKWRKFASWTAGVVLAVAVTFIIGTVLWGFGTLILNPLSPRLMVSHAPQGLLVATCWLGASLAMVKDDLLVGIPLGFLALLASGLFFAF